MKIIEKLKQKWGVGIWGFLAIMMAFSLAGTTSVFLRKKMNFLPENLPFVVNILLFFLTYQILLLTYGTALGKFRFFWEKEKKMFLFLLRPVIPKKNQEADHMYSKPTD
ncbi:MAG: DUF6787 family protein [Candidatus Poribacteria bacterium]|nr:DUF6787 family protein [Candidatus Poribacteria bacterium]